jgi:hypothetical protein
MLHYRPQMLKPLRAGFGQAVRIRNGHAGAGRCASRIEGTNDFECAERVPSGCEVYAIDFGSAGHGRGRSPTLNKVF